MIAMINEGYSNSKIPLRVKLHCMELAADFKDDGRYVFPRFAKYKSSWSKLR
jgi:hypothetical protein